MGNPKLWAIVAMLAVMAAGPAWPEGNADAARGIVAEYCTACHVVPDYKPRFAKADVRAPDFQAIADQPDIYSRERLTTFLSKPHYPMAKFIFSASDVDNLVAFITALRKP